MQIKIDFKQFTGWVVVYNTTTRYPEYKQEQWIETANSYKEIYRKAQNAINEYFARDIIIYYIVDGIAEKEIDDFNTSIQNMKGKRNEKRI